MLSNLFGRRRKKSVLPRTVNIHKRKGVTTTPRTKTKNKNAYRCIVVFLSVIILSLGYCIYSMYSTLVDDYVESLPTTYQYHGSSVLDIDSYEPLGGFRYMEYKDGDTPYVITKRTRIKSDNLANERKVHVKNAMKHAWNGYKTYAYGYDNLKPIRGVGMNKWGAISITLIDSLDTLWIMDMKDEFNDARDWIEKKLHFDHDHIVSVFETTIRVLGGLLGAYEFSKDRLFLEKAEDIGQRLLKAFDGMYGMPNSQVNLKKGSIIPKSVQHKDNDGNEVKDGDSVEDGKGGTDGMDGTNGKHVKDVKKGIEDNHGKHGKHSKKGRHGIRPMHKHRQRRLNINIAESGTLQVEFRYLAKATGNPHYKEQVEKAYDKLLSLEDKDGFYPPSLMVSPNGFVQPGSFKNYAFGGANDSYYEYMLKLWLQGNKKEDKYREAYDRSMDAMHEKFLTKSSNKEVWIIGSVNRKKESLEENMEHLTCFMGGLLALGAYTDPNGIESERAQRDLKTARAVTYTCYQMYAHTKTGLSPESVHTHKKMKSSHAAYYMLRPETVESFYILSTLTGDPIYREWGWEIFQSIEKYCKTEIAYGHYHNVNDATIDPEDNLESFFLAETLKYLYLLFDTDSEIDILGKHVFNTEAHPLSLFSDE